MDSNNLERIALVKTLKKTTAILLCGGKGKRLRPVTEDIPKPLVPLNGKPILHHLMSYLYQAGIERFLLATGYRGEQIENYVKVDADPRWKVECINSGDASMTDRIVDCRSSVEERALVCYGDTLAKVDLKSLHAKHEKQNALATLTVYPLKSPFGVVDFNEEGKIETFREKPELPFWINIGFLLLEKSILDGLEKGDTMENFLETLTKTEKFFVHQHKDKHLTINTEKELREAEKDLLDFYTVNEEAA